MRRRRRWLLWCAALLWATTVFADEAPPSAQAPVRYDASDKLVRGIANLITAPLEIPRWIRRRTDGDRTVRGWSLGISQGLGYAVVRVAAGAYEVLTFPAPAPKDYAPVLEPAYVWDPEPPR